MLSNTPNAPFLFPLLLALFVPAGHSNAQAVTEPPLPKLNPEENVQKKPVAGGAFRFDTLRELAAERAAAPYTARSSELPAFWRDLTPPGTADAVHQSAKYVWAEEKRPFQLALIPAIGGSAKMAGISTIKEGKPAELPWDNGWFQSDKFQIPADTAAPAGFSGLQICTPLNTPEAWEPLLTLHSSGYFRAISPHIRTALSARVLAVNTAQKSPEEFPAFERFWIVQPESGARDTIVMGLVDSPSVAGAYKFRVVPGRETVVEVEAEITLRQSVDFVGIAPFSSSFSHSELTHPRPADYRPEVHLSDGLLIHLQNNEAIWRPLDQAGQIRRSTFAVEKFQGFGLLQRDRNFASYQDLNAEYERQASVFVEPMETWPEGRIHLVEMPMGERTWDNVVACWAPSDKLKPGQPFRFSYRIHWTDVVTVPGLSSVLATRHSHVPADPAANKPAQELYVIDFSDPATSGAGTVDENEKPDLHVEVPAKANLLERSVVRNPSTNGWRAIVRVSIGESEEECEIACRLLLKGRPISEKWNHLWKK